MKLFGRQTVLSEWSTQNVTSIVCAVSALCLFSMWLCSASRKTSLVLLSFHLHPSVRGFLRISCCHCLQCCSVSSQQDFRVQHTLLSLCSHGSVPSRQLSVVSVRSCLSSCAIISRLLCCSCSMHDIWTSAAYVLFLMSFPIVFSLNYSAPPSLLKFFPGLP